MSVVEMQSSEIIATITVVIRRTLAANGKTFYTSEIQHPTQLEPLSVRGLYKQLSNPVAVPR